MREIPTVAQAKAWDRARVARMNEPRRGWTSDKKIPAREVSSQDKRAKARRKADLDMITC